MKHLLALTLAAAAALTFGTADVQAGTTASRVHSSCGHCRQPVHAYYRPVRYVNSRAVYGWIPNYHGNCGSRTPVQVYNYGYGNRVTRYYTYPDVRSYNVYRNYPTTRAISGFGFTRCR
ncbi:MAG: hypothetical protein JNK37_25080 [Verrucomicrobiales bacterium]|nr:hypothetical protein [Verrucomicrobiales bacterium]